MDRLSFIIALVLVKLLFMFLYIFIRFVRPKIRSQRKLRNASAGRRDSDCDLLPCTDEADLAEPGVTLSPSHKTTEEGVYVNNAAIKAPLLDQKPPHYNHKVLTIQPAQEPPPYYSLCEVPHYSSEDKTVDQRLIDLS